MTVLQFFKTHTWPSPGQTWLWERAAEGSGRTGKGLAQIDPASEEVWDYNIAITKGFNQVQFDYVRFPSDGKLKTMSYPVYQSDVSKQEIIRRFFEYADQQMKPVDVLTSADIFGLTTMVEYVADYVYFVCPMIYPSHYPKGHLGLKNSADYPYRIIYDASLRA